MSAEYFPPRFWGLDPLFSAKIKLNISDVLALSCYPDFPGQYPGNDIHRDRVIDTNISTIYACTLHMYIHTHGSFSLPLLTPRSVLYREPPCGGCACDGRRGFYQEEMCPHTV